MYCERLDAIAAASGGQIVCGRPDLRVTGFFSDTRTPVRGGLFIALRGERFDGNDYAVTAITEHGAAAVLLDRPDAARGLPAHAGAVLVSDTREGYLGLAAARRTKLSAQLWFGITGSVGKSTTKEMLAHILEHATRWKVHKAKGSFNNAVGLSHTMLGATGRHQAVVLELGTNHPGEIRQLAAVARPNVAVITCAAASHLEAFGSIENVAREKAEILAFQTHEDTAVLNADSPYLELWRGRAKGTVMTFGVNAAADLRAVLVHVNGAGCAQFMVERGGVAVACGLRVPGVHQVSNGLAALAASVAGGIALEDAAAALSTFESVAHRFQVTPVRGMTLIDDTYNANPASFAAALETLKSLEAGRRFVVAGDMLELGENAEELHRELGRQIAGCNVSGLVTVGTLAAAAGEAALIRGLPRESWRHYATPEEAAATLRPLLAPGDAVLVKGSHGIHLDKCCELLKTSA